MWFFAILIVLALGAIAVVAAGRGAPLEEAYDDAPDSLVPAEGTVTADDLRRVRFPTAFRGYRMAEVDALLERLADERELAERDQRLRGPDSPDVSTDGGTESSTDSRTDEGGEGHAVRTRREPSLPPLPRGEGHRSGGG